MLRIPSAAIRLSETCSTLNWYKQDMVLPQAYVHARVLSDLNKIHELPRAKKSINIAHPCVHFTEWQRPLPNQDTSIGMPSCGPTGITLGCRTALPPAFVNVKRCAQDIPHKSARATKVRLIPLLANAQAG